MPDMEEKKKREINQISNLKERVAFKDIVEQIFLSLYETNQEMYNALEERIMGDLAFDINRYRICTGIVEREYVDRSHHLFSLMKEDDLALQEYDTKKIHQKLLEEGLCPVKTLFLECDFLQIKKLLERQRVPGKIQTDKDTYEAEFVLLRNETYLKEVVHLYEVFINNGLTWQTVNAPYLYKFIDVCLDNDSVELPPGERIMEIAPDLEEFGEWAHDNYIPLWNIRKMELDSVGFPVPCEDHRSFEHLISIKEYGNEHVYLIDDSEHIINVRQEENRLIVMGDEAEARKWKVYMIRNGQHRKFERFSYPVMANQRKDEFVERFWRRQGKNVRTEAELIRFIRGFGMEEYVELEGYELTDRGEERAETYSMNSFILDEIREKEYKKCLLLKFTAKGKHDFLIRDVMSFLVSEVQLLYPEYLCEGKLLGKKDLSGTRKEPHENGGLA